MPRIDVPINGSHDLPEGSLCDIGLVSHGQAFQNDCLIPSHTVWANGLHPKSQSSQEAALFTGCGAGEAEARCLDDYKPPGRNLLKGELVEKQ